MITTQKELRAEFWEFFPQFKKRITPVIQFEGMCFINRKAREGQVDENWPTKP